ncbi:MAG: alpha/beta hydrolase [Gammaproteobacteria bacterium]|nr:alpha/beta hydrolase [Gammaproteobacteria bacterium]
MQERPTQHYFQTSGARICYFEWGLKSDPGILLLHATGFHARCWDQTIAALPERFHVVAVDMRGHGRSEKVAPYVWRSFATDVRELVAYLGLSEVVGVGHSLGGHVIVQVAADLPGSFARLVLIDPVIFAPDVYGTNLHGEFANPEDFPVARRHNHWVSWQAMYERFVNRKPFSLWKTEVLEDYCRYGVVEREDEQDYELACPPVVEASIYLGNADTDIHKRVPEINIPVTVLRAESRDLGAVPEMDFSKSPTWPGLAQSFKLGRDVYLPHLTHFIPMEDPGLVASFVVAGNASIPNITE